MLCNFEGVSSNRDLQFLCWIVESWNPIPSYFRRSRTSPVLIRMQIYFFHMSEERFFTNVRVLLWGNIRHMLTGLPSFSCGFSMCKNFFTSCFQGVYPISPRSWAGVYCDLGKYELYDCQTLNGVSASWSLPRFKKVCHYPDLVVILQYFKGSHAPPCSSSSLNSPLFSKPSSSWSF